jgi:hypothetical protein
MAFDELPMAENNDSDLFFISLTKIRKPFQV